MAISLYFEGVDEEAETTTKVQGILKAEWLEAFRNTWRSKWENDLMGDVPPENILSVLLLQQTTARIIDPFWEIYQRDSSTCGTSAVVANLAARKPLLYAEIAASLLFAGALPDAFVSAAKTSGLMLTGKIEQERLVHGVAQSLSKDTTSLSFIDKIFVSVLGSMKKGRICTKDRSAFQQMSWETELQKLLHAVFGCPISRNTGYLTSTSIRSALNALISAAEGTHVGVAVLLQIAPEFLIKASEARGDAPILTAPQCRYRLSLEGYHWITLLSITEARSSRGAPKGATSLRPSPARMLDIVYTDTARHVGCYITQAIVKLRVNFNDLVKATSAVLASTCERL